MTQNYWRWVLFASGNAKKNTFALPDAKIPTCWYLLHYLMQIFRFFLTPNLIFALPPTPTPDTSQWNIGGGRAPGVGAGVRLVHFKFFASILFAFGSQFPVEYGLNGSTLWDELPINVINIPILSKFKAKI